MEQTIPITSKAMIAVALRVVSALPVGYEIVIRKISRTRTGAQNRLYWKWLGEIAAVMEVPDRDGVLHLHTKDDWHDMCRMKWIGIKWMCFGGKEFARPSKSTTKLTVTEFAEYLTEIDAHFREKGVSLTYTNDYAKAMGIDEC